jgi:folate-binding protein YgfZ
MDSAPSLLAELEAMRSGAAVFHRAHGVVRLDGSESVDFLQRLSTNDVSPLNGQTAVSTVLTNEKGRVIDLCHLLPLEKGLLCLTSPDRALIVKAWLEKFIIMEDITITDLSSTLTTSWLLGPKVESTILKQTGTIKGVLDAASMSTLESRPKVISLPPSAPSAFRTLLFGGKSAIDPLCAGWQAEGTLAEVGAAAFESLRILNGIPRIGVDAGEQDNPLEASLREYVSFTKGCYIGQEVIARIDTYKKQQKALVTIAIDAPATLELTSGEMYSSGEKTGHSTSHACLPGLPPRQIALAYVRTDAELDSLEYVTAAGRFPAHILEPVR